MSDTKAREFYISHSALNVMTEKHHVISHDGWHLKQDPSCLANPELFLRVREVRAGEVCITREELRAAWSKTSTFTDGDCPGFVNNLEDLERELFGEVKG